MGASRFLIAAAFGVTMMGGAAQAADPATWLPDLKKTMHTDLISGWYIRGDAGYRWTSIGSVDSPIAVGRWTFDNAWTIGGGAGYKYHWFRTDLTVDYAQRAEFYGDVAAPANYISTKIDAVTVLGNVYLDLGTWGGFTPYIGAGIGGSYLRTTQYTTSTWQQMDDGRGWSLSWAAMAGLSYRFTHNLVVDVGYRYLSLGEAHTGPLPPGSFTRVTFRDLTAQEVRVGLRMMLD